MPQLFALSDDSLQAASPNVWERTDDGVIEEEDMDVELLLFFATITMQDKNEQLWI